MSNQSRYLSWRDWQAMRPKPERLYTLTEPREPEMLYKRTVLSRLGLYIRRCSDGSLRFPIYIDAVSPTSLWTQDTIDPATSSQPCHDGCPWLNVATGVCRLFDAVLDLRTDLGWKRHRYCNEYTFNTEDRWSELRVYVPNFTDPLVAPVEPSLVVHLVLDLEDDNV